jgi:hypothetical protein
VRFSWIGWAKGVRQKIGRKHHIEPKEVIDVLRGVRQKPFFTKSRSGRYVAYGTTSSGRYVMAVVEWTKEKPSRIVYDLPEKASGYDDTGTPGLVVITARELEDDERRVYQNQTRR